MTILAKSLLGATAATALAVAAPAQARDHDRGIDAGDVIAGALIIGGIAAIASAASDNNDRYDDRRYRDRPYQPGPNGRYDRRDQRYSNARRGNGQRAVNRCSAAAQQEASRYGQAQVTRITEVDRKRDGWEIRGRVLVNEGYYGRQGRYGNNRRSRYANYDEGRFTCRIRRGQIDRVRVRGI